MALNNSKRTYDSFSEPTGASRIFSEPVLTYKRARQDIEPSLWNQILTLPHTTTQSLLYQMCSAHPSLSSFITSAHNARAAAEAARPPVNFDSYSRDCWFTMNKKYKRLSCGQQFEMMGDICQVLDESRDAIVEAAGAGVRWETRRNALEVLRKISKSIMLCDEPQIRHELMKDGYMLGQFADSMQELARGMTKEERGRYKEEGLYKKLVELRTECDPMHMDGLPAVYRIFDCVEDDDEEEGEDEEQEDNIEDSDAPAVDEAYLQNIDNEDEGTDSGTEEADGGAVIRSQDHSSPALQRFQDMMQPSNTHRTRVFSIGELA
ncbi:hypothetical protein WAI453_004434 [Rhynchosporium graminicola]|uniref:Uncharacterized protein n=1 Tax=Rhynchosporium graminicola TaxID=2792576 RepID=A0A1E1L5H9_9HELO|nr:uncharacterized protein RCO7_03944 [Rhynchosporium commune]